MTSPPSPPTPPSPSRTIDPRLVIAGVVIAAAIPAIVIATALLWSNHLISLDGDEAVVSAVESATFWALPLGPIGFLLLGLGLRLRSVTGWIGLFAVATPTILIGWFIAAAFFGGLAGEPF